MSGQSPYRQQLSTQPEEVDHAPRVVFDERIYPDSACGEHKRVRVVRVHRAVGDKIVRDHVVEVALKRSATGEPVWEPLDHLIGEDQRVALAALARGLDCS